MAASLLRDWRIKALCKMPPDWWAAPAVRGIVIAPSNPISIPSSACTFRRLAATTRHLCKWPNSVANWSRPQADKRTGSISICICIRIVATLLSGNRPWAQLRLQLTIVLRTAVHQFGFSSSRGGFKAPSGELATLFEQFIMLSFCSLSFAGANPSPAIGRPIRAQPCSSKSL